MGAFARFVVRFRVAIVVVWGVLLIGASVALPALSSEVNSDPSLFLSSAASSVKAQVLGASLVGARTTSKITIVAARADGPLTAADIAAVTREASAAKAVPGVSGVRAIAVSPGQHAVQLQVSVPEDQADVAGLRPVVNDLAATIPPDLPAGLQMHLAGQVAANAASNKTAGKAMKKIEMLSVLFIVVLLLLVLRSPVAVVVAFVPSLVSLLMAERLIAELGAHGLRISTVTQTLLIVLVLGAGTDYGLFLVYRFREEHTAGGGDPVVSALTRVGESIMASAGTVIVALLTLLLAGFGLYHDLAVPLSAGVAVMLAAGLTLLPALVSLTGRWMFPVTRSAARDAPPPGEGWWGRVAARAVGRPALVLGTGALVLGAVAVAALGYQTAGVSKSSTAPAGSDAAAGNAMLARYFPQSSASPASLVFRYLVPVWTRPAALTAAAASLRSSGLFGSLAGPLDPNGTTLTAAEYASLHAELGNPRELPLTAPATSGVPASRYQAYRASAQYVSADGTTVRFIAGLRAGPQQSAAAMRATPLVRAAVTAAATRSGASGSGLAGQAAGLYDVSDTAGHDMLVVIPVAVLAIAVLLGLVLRSLVAPVYLVVSIVLSYLAALGLTTLLVIDIGGQAGLVFVLPFLMFVFLLALGEDYNILVMARIREEARAGLPLRQAVARAIGRTGPTVTSAGLVLAGTFGVFALAGGGVMNGQLQSIGLGLAIGVLLDTFVVRTLLVPSAAVLLGRWNWWPSRLAYRGSAAGTPR